MQRVAADDVLAAYSKIGGLPIRGAYRAPGGCYCPLVALAYGQDLWAPSIDDDDGEDAQSLGREIARLLGLDWEYARSFIAGFDLAHEDKGMPDGFDPLGWIDGAAVAEAVFSRFWAKPPKRRWYPDPVKPEKQLPQPPVDDEDIPF